MPAQESARQIRRLRGEWLVALLLALALGCGTNSGVSKRPQRVLETVVVLTSESGAPMARQPLEVRFEKYFPKGVAAATDAAGRWVAELVDHPTTGWLWDPLLPPPPLPRRLALTVRLPALEPRAAYPISIRFEGPVPADRRHAPPVRIEPDLEAVRAGQVTIVRHGARYRPLDGSLLAVEIVADGADTRLVPAVWHEPDAWHHEGKATPGAPGAPRLQVSVRTDRVAADRDRISIELAVVYHDDEVAVPRASDSP